MYNTMGNYLVIKGKGARETIESILSADPESLGSQDRVVDFSKIIPVNNIYCEEECMEKWGARRNASNTQYYYEGEGNPPNENNVVYFDSSEDVPMVIAELAKQHPDLEINYEYCDEDTEIAGERIYIKGVEIHSFTYEERSKEMMSIFFNIWGREDEFYYDEKENKYINKDEVIQAE